MDKTVGAADGARGRGVSGETGEPVSMGTEGRRVGRVVGAGSVDMAISFGIEIGAKTTRFVLRLRRDATGG